MKKLFFTITLFAFAHHFHAQIVNIPDTNFKNALINTLCIDTNGDGVYNSDADANNDNEIQVSEAEAILRLNLDSQNISNLIGIEKFTNLELLKCSLNSLTSLDLSKNILLKHLYCDDNQIAILNVSENSNLELLNCLINNLTTLDVSRNNNLQVLYCGFNKLTSLDVSNNASLISLFCYTNELTSLNIKNGNNTQLLNMFALDNNNLTCITVDEVDFANNAVGWLKDPAASYSVNCGVLGNDDVEYEMQVNCYPNPVNDVLQIMYPSTVEIKEIRVYNALGVLEIAEKSNFKQLDVSKLNQGLYVVVIETDNNSYTKRIVKK